MFFMFFMYFSQEKQEAPSGKSQQRCGLNVGGWISSFSTTCRRRTEIAPLQKEFSNKVAGVTNKQINKQTQMGYLAQENKTVV